jgi:hypothetical protein|tara:strand:- start:261 stop:629 length:369 start_codon:yes stop_codon:yes gene_type:complete
MTIWARTEETDGTLVVAELTDTDPAGRFHESLVWHEVTSDVEQRWESTDGGTTFTAPDETPPMSDVRSLRDSYLKGSDWTDLNNAPLTAEKVAEWQTYRQAMRDLPANTPDTNNPPWPTPPE